MLITKKECDYIEGLNNQYNIEREYKSMINSGYDKSIENVKEVYDNIFNAYTYLGFYPVLFTHDGNCYCNKCAKRMFIMYSSNIDTDIYYEGDTVYCDICNIGIDSAYGNPREEKSC